MLPLTLALPFALVGLIWGAVIFRRIGLVGGCLATLLVGSCFGYEFFHASMLTADRMLLAGLVGAYFFRRNFAGLEARAFTKADVVLALFILCLVGSTFAGDWRWQQGRPVSLLLFFYLLPLALYWVASRCPITERAHRGILGFFVLFGIYLSATALCEVLGIHALVFPRYISNPNMIEFLGRARGPFLNPIGNGMYLSAGLLACLLSWPFVAKAHRPGMLALAGLTCVGALCTLTRSVWLGVACALVGLAVMIVPQQFRLRVIVAAAVSGGVALGLLGSNLVSFKRDKHVSVHQMEDSAKLRPILAAFAYEMFKDHPLTGVGLSQYKRYNIEYLTKTQFDLPLAKAKDYVQHNIFLSLLVETGLLGVVMFILVLGVWLLDGWKLWHATELPLWQRQFGLFGVLMVVAYLSNGMFHEMSVIPMMNMLMFLVAGFQRNMVEQCLALGNASRRQSDLQLEDRRQGGSQRTMAARPS